MKDISEVKMVKTTFEDICTLICDHIKSFSHPVDAFVEESISNSSLFKFEYKGDCIGYTGMNREELQFFYIKNSFFRYASQILERIVAEKGIKSIFVMTQDSLLSALAAEWDYEKKEKCACWFTDNKSVNVPEKSHLNFVFREAIMSDVQSIRGISGDFFDDIEENIKANALFLLEENNELLGCGIAEKHLISEKNVSIGMFVNKKYRNRGIARTILLYLKEWAYKNGFTPVAGCWYYNTLSRKSLESAGMIAAAVGYTVNLTGKERLPLRSGNAPGEC